MADGIIEIKCPPMLVKNTSRLPLPGTPRLAVELACTGFIQLNGRMPIPFLEEPEVNHFRFPSCLITKKSAGKWEVEEVRAWGNLVTNDLVVIDYPVEPIERRGGVLNGTMFALAINNNVDKSTVWLEGIKYSISAPLPEAEGKPNDGMWGLRSYLVNAVTITGTLTRIT